jgi:hypothetical protein
VGYFGGRPLVGGPDGRGGRAMVAVSQQSIQGPPYRSEWTEQIRFGHPASPRLRSHRSSPRCHVTSRMFRGHSNLPGSAPHGAGRLARLKLACNGGRLCLRKETKLWGPDLTASGLGYFLSLKGVPAVISRQAGRSCSIQGTVASLNESNSNGLDKVNCCSCTAHRNFPHTL